jgi:alkanesulfonate monooxygenase SsuD/methylene tetrahydromethanopterin reductase-like flavin-dependent oxidoreductase (luciferase family)
MPAGLPFDRMAAGVEQMRQLAIEAERDPSELMVAPQAVLCIDRNDEAAAGRFRHSQVYEHLSSLRTSTLRNIDIDAYMSQNLIGSPDEIIRRIHAMADAGANHLAGMIVVANTQDEMMQQIRLFAHEVLPAFRAAS